MNLEGGTVTVKENGWESRLTMERMCAPIVLFVFNRLDHAQRAVEALQKNELAEKSELYIYSDGARDEREQDSIERVRNYCRNLTGFAQIHLLEREENWGIEKSEIAALSEILERYDACIVLEDDLEVGSQFLKYMNLALERYREEKKVISIAGYSNIDAIPGRDMGQEFYFSQMITSWGWATWADRWKLFDDKELNVDILKSEEARKRFDLDGACPYTQMLQTQIENHYITWDVAWYFKAFEQGMLTLTPVYTLVNNIGMDGSGVHYSNEAINSNRIRNLEWNYSFSFPEEVKLDEAMRELEKKGITKQKKRERRKYRIWRLQSMIKGVFHV